METQTAKENQSMLESDVLDRISSRRIPISKTKLERFKNGDLGAIPMHCVDGRPDKEQISPCIQRLGGAFGYLVALLSASRMMSGSMCDDSHLQRVEDIILTSFGKSSFVFHSDDRNNDHCGCGFLKSVMKDPEAFGLAVSDWNRIEKLIPKARRINVLGEHKEVGVLVVTTPEFILKGEEQFFVDNRFLDDIALSWLCSRTAWVLDLDEQEFFEVARKMRNANVPLTLRMLGADKLPVYIIS